MSSKAGLDLGLVKLAVFEWSSGGSGCSNKTQKRTSYRLRLRL